MRARSRARTRNTDADLSTLDFLSWAKFELSHETNLKVRMTGHAMVPAIADSELIIIEQVGRDELSCGDIVLYASLSDTAVIQRVLRFEESSYGLLMVTRGDACGFDNVPVPTQRVLGKVIGVERNGVVVPLNQARLNLWQRLLVWLGLKEKP